MGIAQPTPVSGSSPRRRIPASVRVVGIACLLVALGVSWFASAIWAGPERQTVACNLPNDFPIPGGWFFQQMKRVDPTICAGYSVIDDAQASMWTEYYRWGGVKILGYPVSRRYSGPGGYIQQAFEYAVLQWRPEENRAIPALIFEQFHDAVDPVTHESFDQRLRFLSIPQPVAPPP